MYDFDLNPMKEQLQMHQVRNMLMHWYEYEHSLNTFDEHRFLQIKSFFYRLSYLTKDERDFLAYIYYHEKPKDRPNNQQIAEHFSLKNIYQVTNYKNKIILKLLSPVSEPCKAGNTKDSPKGHLIEQLFNELQKMHP